MSWHARLSKRLDHIEASTQRIKARLLRCIAQETGQTEAQVWAELVADRDRRQASNA
jgi:hypothetical protein